MTLSEAIIHYEEVAKAEIEKANLLGNYSGSFYTGQKDKCERYASENRQLVDWLKDYKRLLEKEDTLSNIKCSTCKYNETSEKCDKCYLYSEWRKVNETD